MDDLTWTRLVEWARRADYRDMSDEANRWADEEAERAQRPENIGEWKASLALAFEAGRQFEVSRDPRHKYG